VRPDDDAGIAKTEDRGEGVGRGALQDLEAVIRRPALLAAEIAVKIQRALILRHKDRVAGAIGDRRGSGRGVPEHPGKPLAVDAVPDAGPGRRSAPLHDSGVALEAAKSWTPAKALEKPGPSCPALPNVPP